jgi:hypothetical protein
MMRAEPLERNSPCGMLGRVSEAMRVTRRWAAPVVLVVSIFGCSDAVLKAPATGEPPAPGDTTGDDEHDAGASPARDASTERGGSVTSTSNLRILAGNISSGATSTYDSGEGIRILQGLHPDVALLQELNYKTNSKADLDELVADAFGAGFTYYREDGLQIPNA